MRGTLARVPMILAGLLVGSPAQAASIVELEAMDRPLGPSMLALGTPAPKESEAAASPPARAAARGRPPVVMRGGLVGEVFKRSGPPPAAAPSSPSSSPSSPAARPSAPRAVQSSPKPAPGPDRSSPQQGFAAPE